MTVKEATWHAALAPYVERDDLIVDFAHPFLRPTGERVDSVPSVFMRFPQWKGAPIGDDSSKKSPSMIDLDGEALFPELAVLRLLERDGWVFSSQPVSLVADDDGLRVERRRQAVSPSGEIEETTATIGFDYVSADRFEAEARGAGLEPAGRREVPETLDHFGSMVVICRR